MEWNHLKNAARAKRELALGLSDVLERRFTESESEIYEAMKWYDPQYWDDHDADYGKGCLEKLIEHFKTPLEASNTRFDACKALSEWRSFRSFAKHNYSQFLDDPKKMWQKTMLYRRKEFPNLCCIVELLTCISGSNSSVERAFSVLTLLLSDRRLSHPIHLKTRQPLTTKILFDLLFDSREKNQPFRQVVLRSIADLLIPLWGNIYFSVQKKCSRY